MKDGAMGKCFRQHVAQWRNSVTRNMRVSARRNVWLAEDRSDDGMKEMLTQKASNITYYRPLTRGGKMETTQMDWNWREKQI